MPTLLSDDELIFDHIQLKDSEILLQLNDCFFELSTAKPFSLDITYTTPILDKCEQMGINSELHKSSINTISQ